MTTQEMIDMLAGSVSYDLDNYQGDDTGAVTDAQAVAQLNYGLRTVANFVRPYADGVTLTLVSGTQTYNTRNVGATSFSKKMIEVKRVLINGSRLYTRNGGYGMWSQREVEEDYPSYLTDASGTPTKAWQVGDLLYLHSKPNAGVVSGGSNYVSGIYMPADLSAAALSAAPDISEETHEAIVRIAATLAADPTAAEAEGLARLQRYEGRAYQALNEVRLRYARIHQSGTTRGPRASHIRN
jgi:hypothetical protein